VPVWVEQISVEIRADFVAWLILALASAPLVLGLWFWAGGKRSLFPTQRTRFVPWSGFEVCFAFLFTQLILPALLNELLNRIGFFNRLYGPGFDAAPGAADGDLTDARRGLWVSAFAFPVQLIGIVIALRGLSGTRFYQLGLTPHGSVQNMLSGWVAWLLLTLPVLMLNILVTWAYRVSEGVPPEEHPLARLARGQPLAVEWVLIVLSGVVIAPIREELLFRSVLQGWVAARPWGAPITLACSVALTSARLLGRVTDGRERVSLGSALEPIAFVLIMVAVCFIAERLFRRRLPPPHTAWAISSSAMLFAVFHDWPTPVPLFVLGLGLGYLAYRTQSLVAPIVMHALFNGVACLLMLLTYARA
jgi:membrane protease YdiL (CAAX protease family)